MFSPAGRSSSSSDGNSRGGEKAAREHMLLLPISESQMEKMQKDFFIWTCGHSLSLEKRHKIAHCVNYRFSSECVPLYTTVAHWHCPWVLCTGRVATHDFLGQEAVQVHPGFTSTFHVNTHLLIIFHSDIFQHIVFSIHLQLLPRLSASPGEIKNVHIKSPIWSKWVIRGIQH